LLVFPTGLTDISDGYLPSTRRPVGLAVGNVMNVLYTIDPTDVANPNPITAHPLPPGCSPHAVCQIGGTIYVLGTKAGFGALAHVWALDAELYTVLGGPWAGGLALTGVDLGIVPPIRNRMIGSTIVGPGGDCLVVVSTGENGLGQPITVVDVTTGTFVSGAGSIVGDANAFPEGGVCELNGIVFFSIRQAIGGVSQIAVVETATCTCPNRYGAHPWHNETGPGTEHVFDMTCDGICVWWVTSGGKLYAMNAIVASTATVADGDVWSHEATFADVAGGADDACRLTFDGLRLWVVCPENATNRHAARWWPPDRIQLGNPAGALSTPPHYLHTPVCAGYTHLDTQPGRCIVLGDALWGIIEESTAVAYRLPQLGMRH
jgi:hypothetical protein